MSTRDIIIPGIDKKEIKSDLSDFNRSEQKILEQIVPGLYPSWKRGQLSCIRQIQDSTEPIIALRAPTGFGKSAVAIAVNLLNGGKCLNLTQTIQLGEQYLKDFISLDLKTVKGRSNFPCTIIPAKNASEAPCVGGMKCKFKSGGCDYYDQKIEASDANIVAMNINYFLFEANYAGTFSNKDVLFIDEAHKLDSALRSFIEVRLSKRRFKENNCPVPNNSSIEALLSWKDAVYPDLKDELDDINERLEINYSNDILIAQSTILSGVVHQLRKLELVDDTWLMNEDNTSVALKPLWISRYTEKFIFNHSKKTVLMSGTLPMSTLDKLGIIKYHYIKMASTFPPENRPIIAIAAANLARSAKEPLLEQKKLIAATKLIIKKHNNQKGIIHTSNYMISKILVDALKNNSDIFTHEDASTRIDCLEKFTKSKAGILISPSFTEGIDLPYDGCRWQIIAKIPYLNLGDEQVNKRNKDDPKWYSTETIITLVQAYGRIMRSEDDSGTTYILDSSLLSLIQRWRPIFNEMEWFLEALFIVQSDNSLIPFLELEQGQEQEGE